VYLGILSAFDSELTQDIASYIVSFIARSKSNRVGNEEEKINAPHIGRPGNPYISVRKSLSPRTRKGKSERSNTENSYARWERD